MSHEIEQLRPEGHFRASRRLQEESLEISCISSFGAKTAERRRLGRTTLEAWLDQSFQISQPLGSIVAKTPPSGP